MNNPRISWDSSEFEAWRVATADAVDGEHVPGWCEHCGRVKRLRDYWMSDRAAMLHILELRRHPDPLLRAEGLLQ